MSLVLSFGCTPPPPAPAPKAAPPPSIITLKQLMEWVLDPAADVIWDSVKTIYSQAGTKEIKPETKEQWEAVRNAAATLTESSSMLLADGRARDADGWVSAAGRLGTAAGAALMAADAKNVEALFDAGGEIYNACRTCHQKYAPHLQGAAPASSRPPLVIAQHR